VAGEAETGYGLVFHWAAASYDYFWVSQSKREFALARFNGDTWDYVLPPKPTTALYYNLSPGYGGNVLGARVAAGQIELFTNGERVAQLADETNPPPGPVGIAATVGRGNDFQQVEFDNFIWRAPPATP
jgi:hypothetical protein